MFCTVEYARTVPQKDVFRLNIPVDDVVAMEMVEGHEHLEHV